MTEQLRHFPLIGRQPGSCAVVIDAEPLGIDEVREHIIPTNTLTSLGGDILADQACSVVIVPLPEGLPADQGGTEGETSETLSVVAAAPARWSYSQVRCLAVAVRVTNTSGVAMTAYKHIIRGEA